MRFSCGSLLERLHLSTCLFSECWNSDLKATSLERGVPAAHCHLHHFRAGVAHTDGNDPACGQPKCSDLHLNTGNSFMFSEAARHEFTDALSSQVLSGTTSTDIWSTMEQSDSIAACSYLLEQGFRGVIV